MNKISNCALNCASSSDYPLKKGGKNSRGEIENILIAAGVFYFVAWALFDMRFNELCKANAVLTLSPIN